MSAKILMNHNLGSYEGDKLWGPQLFSYSLICYSTSVAVLVLSILKAVIYFRESVLYLQKYWSQLIIFYLIV